MAQPRMVTVYVDTDERYPEVIVKTEPAAYMSAVRIPMPLLRRHEKALAEFNAVQDELYAIYRRDA